VYAAELAQTILYTKMAFQEFATDFGNDLALAEVGLLWFAGPVLTAIVSFVVQIFYAYRIRVFTQSNFIAIVVTLLALLQLAGGIAEGVIGSQIFLFSSNLSLKKIYISTGVCAPTSSLLRRFMNPLFTVLERLQRCVRSGNCSLHDLLPFPTEIALESDPTDNSETDPSDRCDGGFDRRCLNRQSHSNRPARQSSNILRSHHCDTCETVFQRYDGGSKQSHSVFPNRKWVDRLFIGLHSTGRISSRISGWCQ
jgi:hypothetical protein